MPQYCRLHNKQSLSDRMRWFQWRFLQNCQTFAVKIVERTGLGRSFFKKPHSRIRFDLFNFSKGLHPKYMVIWKPNSRTQHVRLGHVLSDGTIWLSRQDLHNENRTARSPPDDIDAKILAIWDKSPFDSTRSIGETLYIVHSTVLLHLHDSIGFRSFHLLWVPHLLMQICAKNERSLQKRIFTWPNMRRDKTSYRPIHWDPECIFPPRRNTFWPICLGPKIWKHISSKSSNAWKIWFRDW
jgi:hypothetical protein